MHIITAIDQNDGQQQMSDLVAAGSVASRMADFCAYCSSFDIVSNFTAVIRHPGPTQKPY
jgi:hypothetical protein